MREDVAVELWGVQGVRVLVACEFSGIVREAFRKKGHDAWSCDLLPTEIPGQHIQGDVLEILNDGWDMMIAHPPCTHLAVSGARWFKDKREEQEHALWFVRKLMDAPIPKIAIENPVSIISSRIRKPDQIIQPWQFGHGETKATCLWLKNLRPLKPTNIVYGRENRVHREPPGPDRWKNRSRTYQGIANAMADQWGGASLNKGVGGIEGRASLRRSAGLQTGGSPIQQTPANLWVSASLSMGLTVMPMVNSSIAHLSDLNRPPQIFPIPDEHLPKCAGCGAQWDNHDTGCYCMWGREPSECEGPNEP